MAEKEYSRTLANMRGIDATSDASTVALSRFSFAQNMYKDYKSGQGLAVETFPGTRTLFNFKDKIYGIHHHKDANRDIYVVVHAGSKLYRYKLADRDSDESELIYQGMSKNKSSSFVFNNNLYIVDGNDYIEISSEGKVRAIAEDIDRYSILDKDAHKQAYIPTTYTNGVQYEQRNMLTNKFIEKDFLIDVNYERLPAFETSGELYEKIGDKLCRIFTPQVIEADRYIEGGEGKLEYYATAQTHYEIQSILPKLELDFSRYTYRQGTVADNYIYKIYNNGDKADGSSDVETKNYDTNELKKQIESIKMSANITEIDGTLENFSSLREVVLSDSITHLGNRFFAYTGLTEITLPKSLKKLGSKLFEGCNKLKKIYASEDMCAVLKEDKAQGDHGVYNIPEDAEILPYKLSISNNAAVDDVIGENRVYIYTPCKSIEKVCVEDTEIPRYDKSPDADISFVEIRKIINDKVYIIAIELMGFAESVNKNLYIYGIAHESELKSVTAIYKESIDNKLPADFSQKDDGSVFISHDSYTNSPMEAIKNCTITCTFDDRIFFTGNPDLPNTVFYTQRDLTGNTNPTYFGQLNWFDDGVGNEPNVAMMSNATTLMVLKGDTIQDGSIYYHVGADGGNDITSRIYPSTEGLAGLGCVGVAVNFRDDCCYLSRQGIEAVSKQTVNLERTVEHRSTNIDGLLLKCDLENARAAEWEGYLCILIDGQMFLADSRQMFEGIGGAIEYEWYYVNPVGAYDGDNVKYFLADYMPDNIREALRYNKEYQESIGGNASDFEIEISAEQAAVDYLKVGSMEVETVNQMVSEMVYYTYKDGKKYLVDSYGELEGGTLDKACDICAIGDVLLLGTEGGRVLCVNTDKRGTNPNEPDKSRIPISWYNNSGHAYDAVAVFAMENAGVPYYTKTTVKRGTVLRLKQFPASSIEVYATTDRQATTLITKQSNSITTFDELDFSNIGLLTTDSGILAIKEKTKKWVEKQYMIIGNEYNKPWGLYMITYRYTIQGEVKNK